MDLLGSVGVVLTVILAIWQWRRAVRAEATLPNEVAAAVQAVLSPVSDEEERVEIGGMPHVLSYADVDGDGSKELLVQYPVGAHGSALKVFGWRELEFRELGEMRTGTGAGFDVGDFDADGRIEIRGWETDWSTDEPYCSAPRYTVLHRWDGEGLTEVSGQTSREPGNPFSRVTSVLRLARRTLGAALGAFALI